MESSPEPYVLFVGINIAATSFTVSWLRAGSSPSLALTLDQTPLGWRLLTTLLGEQCSHPHQILVAMEATGVYWIALATRLTAEGFAVSVIPPRQAHHFAKALLKQQKTDAIDSQTLAQLAYLLHPSCWTPPPVVYHELHQRLVQHDMWLALQIQVRNQLHALDHLPMVVAAVRERLQSMLTTLQTQIHAIDREIQQALDADIEWKTTADNLQSIPGIGLVTTAWILTTTVNFTLCVSAEALCSYAGLVPREHRSGTSIQRTPRIGHTGNRRLRTAIYLAALSAIRYNPPIKAFYQRLREAGKPYKVARCAAARKLLHLVWAVASNGQHFDPMYKQGNPM